MITGRKIPREIENPFDNILIDLSEKINPTLRKWGLTPNILTTGSLAFGILSAYFVSINNFLLAALCIAVSYFFDTLDGNMARMFGMVTAFGDWYDHCSDVFKFTLLCLTVLYSTYVSKVYKITFFVCFALFFALTLVHMGCQERSYDKNTFDSLSWLESMCPVPSMIHITKYVGVGTFMFVIVVILLIGGVKKCNIKI